MMLFQLQRSHGIWTMRVNNEMGSDRGLLKYTPAFACRKWKSTKNAITIARLWAEKWSRHIPKTSRNSNH